MRHHDHIVGRAQFRYGHRPRGTLRLALGNRGHGASQARGIEEYARVGSLARGLGERGMSHLQAEAAQHVGIHGRAAVRTYRGKLGRIADEY